MIRRTPTHLGCPPENIPHPGDPQFKFEALLPSTQRQPHGGLLSSRYPPKWTPPEVTLLHSTRRTADMRSTPLVMFSWTLCSRQSQTHNGDADKQQL